MRKKKCKKCVGCDKKFQKGFKGVNKCKYFIKKEKFKKQKYHIKEEKDKTYLLWILFELFIIIAFMYFLYRILMLCVGG